MSNINRKLIKNTKKRNDTVLYKLDFSRQIKYLQYVLLTIVLFVVFYPPFLRGLFFRKELYPTEIIVFCSYLLFQLIKFLKRDKRFLSTLLDYISIAFILVYAISLLNAASIHLAIEEWLKYCMYFAVFSMITEIALSIRNSIFIMWTIVASAVLVSLAGIDAAADSILMSYFNKILKKINIEYLINDMVQGLRISSTLQYANALAAYLMTVFFIVLILIFLSKNIFSRAAASASGFIVSTTFILTQSRGAYIILPLALILFSITLPRKRITQAIASIIGITVPAIAASFYIFKFMSEPQKNVSKIWLIILAGSLVSAISIILIEKIAGWLIKLNWRIYVVLLGIITLTVIAGSLFVINATEPLILEHSDSQEDSHIAKNKTFVLAPNKSYTLEYEVEATSGDDKPHAYQINVYSKNEKDIMFSGQSLIISATNKSTNGIETREVNFTTPNDVKAVSIDFVNFYKGTSAVFYKAHIVDTTDGKIIKNLVMKYKYLPEMIANRLEGVTFDKSTLQRKFYITDGLKIIRDNWLIGAGGGAWDKLYKGYQSYNYNSAQAHNYYLQVVLETGIPGLFVLLGFGIFLVIMFIECKRRIVNKDNEERHIMQSALFAGIVALLVHSAMDFDLALSAITLLLWEMAAIYNANYISLESQMKSIIKVRGIKGRPILVITVSLVAILFPVMFGAATKYAERGNAAVKNNDVKSGLYYMLKAEGFDPWMPQYKIDSANLICVNKNVSPADKIIADKMILRAEKLSKYESKLLPGIGSYYLMTGKIEHGLDLFDRYVNLIPYIPETWEQRVNTYYSVMLKYAESGIQDKVSEYITQILNIIGEAKVVNNTNLDPFIFTVPTMETFERTQYAKDFMEVKESINLDKLILYESGNMDIDNDNKPDGWTFTKEYAKSRKLSLLPGKKYKIELELMDKTTFPSIQFAINGAVDKRTTVTMKNNSYIWEVTVPQTFKPGNNVLTLFMANMDENAIKKLIIEEE